MQKSINKIKNSKAVNNGLVASRAFARTIEILGFAGVGGWLIYTSSDKVTIGVGVALGLVSLAKLVHLAFRAETGNKEISAK